MLASCVRSSCVHVHVHVAGTKDNDSFFSCCHRLYGEMSFLCGIRRKKRAPRRLGKNAVLQFSPQSMVMRCSLSQPKARSTLLIVAVVLFSTRSSRTTQTPTTKKEERSRSIIIERRPSENHKETSRLVKESVFFVRDIASFNEPVK